MSYQFDNAIDTYGQYIEAKLKETETDDRGKVRHIHTLEDLLGLKWKAKPIKVNELKQMGFSFG